MPLTSIDWSAIFGSWPNAFQGAASAVISGMVAALSAYLVVRLTAASDRRRALEDEARLVARELARTLTTTFIGIPDQRPLRADMEMAAVLNMEMRTAAAILARQDLSLAQKIQDHADELARRVSGWNADLSLRPEGAASLRYDQMYEKVNELHELVINWLGDVRPVARQ